MISPKVMTDNVFSVLVGDLDLDHWLNLTKLAQYSQVTCCNGILKNRHGLLESFDTMTCLM